VTEATYEAGFGSTSRVYEKAGPRLGMSPAAYGRGGRGMRITYALADSSLGRVLVAATERGVCAVYLGDHDAALERDLRAEYPEAELRAAGSGFDRRVKDVLRVIEGDAPRAALPLDVKATAFQWRVWQALQAIPAGETRTYGEVAEAIGEPKAARAVARACATNRVGVVIPCHRVVAADGSVSGYRWGKGRKKALLEREGAR
jgi:AraC family transcriptional regulator of adaptative response/methylated-DNA-[protein]-cysteine methyltransferase